MFSILRWPCLWSKSQRINAGQLPFFQLLSGTQLVALCELHKGISCSALCLSFGFESERRAVCLGEGKLITYYTLLAMSMLRFVERGPSGVEASGLAAVGVAVFRKSQPCCSARCLDFFDPVFRSCHRRACGCHQEFCNFLPGNLQSFNCCHVVTQ